MQSFREQANYLIDTSELNVHECKHMVQRHLSTDGDSGLLITLMSFGFRYGVPNNVNILWDVRFLPNPYFVLSYVITEKIMKFRTLCFGRKRQLPILFSTS